MRVLTDMELTSVVGGQSAQDNMQAAAAFCSQNPEGYYERTEKGRELKATVAGTGITVGGGSSKVVVRCDGQGRTNGNDDNDDDKKKEE